MDELGYRRAERNGENPRGHLVISNLQRSDFLEQH